MERLEALIEPCNADHVEFSTKLVERPKDGVRKVDSILEEQCRGLFSQAVTCVFSHLLHTNSSFNFHKVIALVPEELRDGLAKAVEGHVDALLGKFSYDSSESSDRGGGSEGDGVDNDNSASS